MTANYNDFSFFDTQQVFSYHKLPKDIIPASLDVVRSLLPLNADLTKPVHYKLPIYLMNREFIAMLDAIGAEVRHGEVFYRAGAGSDLDSLIHTDAHQIYPGLAKINYVIGGEKNLMKWYRPRIPFTAKNLYTTPIGTKYIAFAKKDCDVYDQVDMQGTYIVNAAIPHSVEMTNGSVDNPRICVSITPRIKGQDGNMGCYDLKTKLDQYFAGQARSINSAILS
jgi:hypothetical protein